MRPAEIQVLEAALKAFQGWIARYYARIALPDELDRRLHKRQFHKKVEKAFGRTLLDGTEDYKVHTDIEKVYIAWSPDRVRWSPDFGQAGKLGSPVRRTDPDDGQADAVFSGFQGEGGAGGAAG
ncbi:hypothetical protein [Dankookia rubra]|uniref:hypothetical protein n=1 Tax=Dankookia rubra TaxID=1442381 RepID=UPI0034DEC1B3